LAENKKIRHQTATPPRLLGHQPLYCSTYVALHEPKVTTREILTRIEHVRGKAVSDRSISYLARLESGFMHDVQWNKFIKKHRQMLPEECSPVVVFVLTLSMKDASTYGI
jgi:hypothetical protein